jgi:RsiW-degrading membrane proteinase PrsW (M82 family)
MTLLLLALAPGLVIALYVYVRDKYEHEPLGLLAWTFALGALGAPLAAVVERLVPYVPLIGPVEEVAKFLAVRLFAYRSREFNEPFDGVVYCVMASMGFATLENVMYVLGGGMSIGIERALISVPGHAAFGAIMGYYVGRAKFEEQNADILLLRGVVFASIAHGVFDFGLFSHSLPGLAGSAIAFIVAVICAIRAIGESSRLSGRFWAGQEA